jgi:tetratricopeptide (TPR) repeat protein
LLKMFWPSGLAVFYPYPASLPVWQVAGAAVLLAGVSWAVVRRRREYPYLAAGWFWYLVTLLPVIGLVQVGAQARADRYTYLPMTGLLIMVGWGGEELWRRWPRGRTAVLVAAGAASMGCAVVAWEQIGYWRDSESLFRHAIEVTEGNYLAEHNLGNALMEERSRLPEAIAHLEASLRVQSGSARTHTDLGSALSRMPERLPEAIEQFRAALQIQPDSPITHNNLGNTLAKMPDGTAAAIGEYDAALRLKPDYAEAHNNLGSALAAVGRLAEARAQFEEALRIEPDYEEARKNLELARLDAGKEFERGVALAKTREGLLEAVRHFEAALRVRAEYPEAENNLGVALSQIPGREKDAIGHFEAALRERPEYADAHVNLAVTLSGMPGGMAEARRHLETALRIQPDPEVRQMLEKLRADDATRSSAARD